MERAKKLLEKSKQHHSLVADSVSFLMYRLGYGDINLAGANSRYKTFTKLEKEFKKQVGTVDFKQYEDDRSNTVWVCWLQGMEHAPALVKHCVASMQYHIKDREFVFIDADNFREYCDIPAFIIEKWRKGIITHTHFSDILRLALLTQHGGLWLDATVYMTDALPAYITEGDFFVYRDGFFNCDVINFGSWIIYSKPNNLLLNETLQLTYEYWKKYNYMRHYFLLHLLFRIVTDCYPAQWEAVPYFSQMDQHIFSHELYTPYRETRFRQLCSLCSVHKLSLKTEVADFREDCYAAKLGELYQSTR